MSEMSAGHRPGLEVRTVTPGRDETPDEALRERVARAITESHTDTWDLPEWDDLLPFERADNLRDAAIALALVLSPKRDEQLRQEGRDEERVRIANRARRDRAEHWVANLIEEDGS